MNTAGNPLKWLKLTSLSTSSTWPLFFVLILSLFAVNFPEVFLLNSHMGLLSLKAACDSYRTKKATFPLQVCRLDRTFTTKKAGRGQVSLKDISAYLCGCHNEPDFIW